MTEARVLRIQLKFTLELAPGMRVASAVAKVVMAELLASELLPAKVRVTRPVGNSIEL